MIEFWETTINERTNRRKSGSGRMRWKKNRWTLFSFWLSRLNISSGSEYLCIRNYAARVYERVYKIHLMCGVHCVCAWNIKSWKKSLQWLNSVRSLTHSLNRSVEDHYTELQCIHYFIVNQLQEAKCFQKRNGVSSLFVFRHTRAHVCTTGSRRKIASKPLKHRQKKRTQFTSPMFVFGC